MSARVAREDQVALGDGRVAGKALLDHGLAGRLAIIEMLESPAAGRGVLLRILDHELDAVLRGAGDERLRTAKGLVVLLVRHVAPGDAGNDGAVGEGERALAIGLDRYFVAQDGADVV